MGTTFEVFMEKFKEFFPGGEDDISDFIDDFEYKKNPLNAELIDNLDEEEYDSYGSEDSKLKRIFYFKEFDIFVQFSGTRCSYEGEEWNEMKEVKKTTKTIETYE